MRRVSAITWILVAMIAAEATAADPPAYNKTDTFEPGKKYTCVPSADRKNWDCNEAGNAAPPTSNASPAETHATAAPPTAAPTRSSTLPSYLTSAAAQNATPPTPPPSTISATADHANARPAESFETSQPAPLPRATPVAATPPQKATARPTAISSSPKPAPIARPAAAAKREAPTPSGGFMDLAGDRFVIELARASSPSSLAESRAAIHVPRGEVYELHLRQNGNDAWLLLWGTFDSIDAARAARSALMQSTSATLGFPRRVAPLQAEARRISL